MNKRHIDEVFFTEKYSRIVFRQENIFPKL